LDYSFKWLKEYSKGMTAMKNEEIKNRFNQMRAAGVPDQIVANWAIPAYLHGLPDERLIEISDYMMAHAGEMKPRIVEQTTLMC
jgi:hypothetical protein